MIAIIDYGVGNLFSLKSSLAQLGQDTVVTADPDTIRKADRLILPGVGAFGDAMDKLVATGLVPVIRAEAEKKPLLGICLGMQLLFEKSYEYGAHRGLGLIPGAVCPLADDLRDAVDVARWLSSRGDVILLSPACSSFDEFSGYEERGRVFKDYVAQLAAAAKSQME